MSRWLNIVGALTIFSGVILYTRAAMGVGGALGGASSRRIGVMRARLAMERAEFARLLARGAKGARITAVLLTIAATAMAVARHS